MCLPEERISVLNGDGDVVLSTAGDGRSLTVPEEQSVLAVSGDGHPDDLLAGVTRVRQQLPRQLHVAAFARKLRPRAD